VWGALQLPTGWLSDRAGRKPLIVVGMLVQGGALAVLVAGGGAFPPALAGATLLGVGTALVYPTLLAAVSDVVRPRDRAGAVGVYRFWRDTGFVVGALVVGATADALGRGTAIALVAGLTVLSGLVVGATPWRNEPSPPTMVHIANFPLDDVTWRRSVGQNATEGGPMRAIDCPCGHHLEGADDEQLFRLAREHVDRDHPELERTDDQLRERIRADAYDPEPARG
jgi:MFS family permease